MPNLTAALAATRAGTADTIVNVVGDSTIAGVNGADATYNKSISIPTRLTAQLVSAGYLVRSDGFFGDAASSTHSSTLALYNTNVTLGAGWAGNGGVAIIGGNAVSNTTTTNALTFCSSVTTTWDVTYLDNATYGSWTYSIDGGSAVTVNANISAGSVKKLTITAGAEGYHCLAINRVSGQTWILSEDPYSTTTRYVRLRNMGSGGSTTAYWVNTASYWMPGNTFAGSFYNANATIVDLGINDMNTSVAAATTDANYATLTTTFGRSGAADVIYVLPTPSKTATISQATQDVLRSNIINRAGTTIPIVDLQWLGTYAQRVTSGLDTATDALHPLPAGYDAEAALIGRALFAVSGAFGQDVALPSKQPVRVITTAGTITAVASDQHICINKTSGAATTANLMASPATGTFLTIDDCKGDAATNNITVTPAAGNIDGSATFVINTNWGSWSGYYNGTVWKTLASR